MQQTGHQNCVHTWQIGICTQKWCLRSETSLATNKSGPCTSFNLRQNSATWPQSPICNPKPASRHLVPIGTSEHPGGFIPKWIFHPEWKCRPSNPENTWMQEPLIHKPSMCHATVQVVSLPHGHYLKACLSRKPASLVPYLGITMPVVWAHFQLKLCK